MPAWVIFFERTPETLELAPNCLSFVKVHYSNGMWRGVIKMILIGIPVLLLLGLLITGIMRLREVSNRAQCQNNLRKIGLFGFAEYNEHEFNPGDPNSDRTFPPGTIANAALTPAQRLSWMVALLPSLGHDIIYGKFDLKKGWDDNANREAITAIVPAYACPSQYVAPAADSPQTNPYIGMSGLGVDAPLLPATDPRAGFIRYGDPTRLSMLRRGLSETITILETSRDHGPWAVGGLPTVRGLDMDETPFIGPGLQFGGHPSGCNAAFADGSVRFMSDLISPEVLQRLIPLQESTIPPQ